MRVLRLAAIMLGAALIASTPAHASDPTPPSPPLWRVTDGDTQMVLFGAMHDLPPDLAWRSPALDQALSGADLVVFETLADDSARSRAVALAFHALMQAPRPLEDALPPDLYARVRQAGERLDLPLSDIQNLRPWAVAMALDEAAVDPEASAAMAWAGADMIIETSLPPRIRREALDTPALLERAFAPVAQAEADEGAGLLAQVLDDLPGRTFDTTVQAAWASGDTGPMVAELERLRADAPRLYAALFDARNRAWVETLTRLMQTERRVVVVVGAGHMVGDAGLPALLRQAGFTVEAL